MVSSVVQGRQNAKLSLFGSGLSGLGHNDATTGISRMVGESGLGNARRYRDGIVWRTGRRSAYARTHRLPRNTLTAGGEAETGQGQREAV